MSKLVFVAILACSAAWALGQTKHHVKHVKHYAHSAHPVNHALRRSNSVPVAVVTAPPAVVKEKVVVATTNSPASWSHLYIENKSGQAMRVGVSWGSQAAAHGRYERSAATVSPYESGYYLAGKHKDRIPPETEVTIDLFETEPPNDKIATRTIRLHAGKNKIKIPFFGAQ